MTQRTRQDFARTVPNPDTLDAVARHERTFEILRARYSEVDINLVIHIIGGIAVGFDYNNNPDYVGVDAWDTFNGMKACDTEWQ